MEHKNKNWVFNSDVAPETVPSGMDRKILAFCDEVMLVENHFKKGMEGALHSHPHTQITYVAEGAFEFTIGDVTKVVRKGDSMLKQDSVIHGCKCVEDGILLDIFTPMREDFVN